MFKTFNYNTENYLYADIIANVLNTTKNELSNLHKTYKKSIKEDEAINKGFPYSEYDTIFHKMFYTYLNSEEGKTIQTNFDAFIKNDISKMFNESFVYQKFPTFRIHLPNSVAVSHWHYDSDDVHLHPFWEINIQIPITNTFGTNAMWIETVPGLKDFSPIEMKYGQYCVFDGNRCTHGSKTNNTDYTRISFDFRVMPISKYNPEKSNASVGTGKKFVIGEYYKLFEK